MVVLFFVLGVVMFVSFLLCKILLKDKVEENTSNVFSVLYWIGGAIVIVTVWIFIDMIPNVANEQVIDNKIVMYEQENKKIENDIDNIVNQYMKHESDTYKDLKPTDDSISLVTLFPELKADNIVQQQIEIYTNNNQKIKDLKEKKIDLAKSRWILYFGK